MYKLDRMRKCKIAFCVLTIIFFVLFFHGFVTGGYEIIQYGFMNEPLSSIIMVSSLFCAIVCLVCFFTANALEKDIAEWLKIIDKNNK